MSIRLNELKLDIEDLNALLESASRQKSKDLLTLEIRKLQTELVNQQKQQKKSEDVTTTTQRQEPANKCIEVKLKNYAWDQSDDFVKIYVTLSNVQSLPKESVNCDYTQRTMDLRVLGLDNKNYQLTINNLCEDILPEKSYHKIKTDMVLICLAKSKKKKDWSCVTGVEKRLKQSKESSKPSDFDKNDQDPSSSLLNIMKKMYDEGDDKLKQTIAQAWTESCDKKGAMGIPPPGFPGL